MAYTDVPNATVGDLYTASDFNTYLRDNFRAGIPDMFTAQGDIAFGAGADTIGIKVLGNAGEWLVANSAGSLGVGWAAPACFFDWFTFGAYTCASLDGSSIDNEIIYVEGVSTNFGIDCSSARIYLVTFNVIRGGDPIISGTPDPFGEISSDGHSWMKAHAFGTTWSSTEWVNNTQAGIIKSGINNDTLAISFNLAWQDIDYKATLKIWGYA